MMYVEFIECDRTMPVEIFRYLGNQESAWSEGSVDKMVLQLGRTMRLGPHPSYLALWDIPDLKRLDEWEDYFRAPAAGQNRRSQAMHRAIHIQRAGVYDVLADYQPPAHSLFVVEYYQPQGAAADGTMSALQKRAKKHSKVSILYVLMRVGALGPDPPLLVIWNGPSYVAFERLFRDDEIGGLRLETCGVYRPLGEEIL
jgi:hypothetical protein